MNRQLPTTLARGWPSMIVLAIVAVQPWGSAHAQLGKALREAAVRDAAEVDGFDIDVSVFHQWIFGAGNKIVSTPDHLEALLMLAVADVDRICSLTEAQRRKLILAGHGDGKRFLDRVAEARREFERLRHDPDGPDEIIQSTAPLAASFQAGLYGEGSLFAKSLGTTLNPEQAGRYREAIREKDSFRYKAKVSLLLASLDARLGFTSEQYRQFLALILEATTPPMKPGGPYEESVVLLKIARLPEEKVRAILDESQWKKLDKIFQRIRVMEENLRAMGQID
jgi:hypothetical protein